MSNFWGAVHAEAFRSEKTFYVEPNLCSEGIDMVASGGSDSSAQVLTDAGDHANIHANVRDKLYYKKILVTLIFQISLFGTKKTF